VASTDIAPPPSAPASIKIRTVGRRRRPQEDFYHFILDLTWPQYILLLVSFFLVTNVAFALIYDLDPGGISNTRPGNLEDCFYFSVQTLATIGYGTMAPVTRFTHIVVVLEAIIGTLSIALIAGVTFAKFARPTAKVLFSDKVVVGPRDGAPHMMFRMANWRHNQMFDVRLRVLLMVNERTTEGETWRRPIILPLVRESTGLFALTWTAMHRVDEQSPFHGADALDKLRAMGGELFLSLTGMDETIGQTINARHRYGLDDIVWGARYADVIGVEPDGTRIIDYRHFHEVIPLSTGGGGADR
jgi:inward rectifier potassium channel